MVVRLAVRPPVPLEEVARAELLVAVVACEVLRMPRLAEGGDHLQQSSVSDLATGGRPGEQRSSARLGPAQRRVIQKGARPRLAGGQDVIQRAGPRHAEPGRAVRWSLADALHFTVASRYKALQPYGTRTWPTMGFSHAWQHPFWVVLTPWRLMSAWRLPSI